MIPQGPAARSRCRHAAARQFFAVAKVLRSASDAALCPFQSVKASKLSLVPTPTGTWTHRRCALWQRLLGQAQAQLQGHPVSEPWRITISSLAFAGMVIAAGPAWAEDDGLLDFGAPGHWRVAIGPYTRHLNQKPEYEYVWAVAVERQRDDMWLYGASYFSNSFGQGCGYLYMGRQYQDLFDVRKLYFQWTAGLLYGYKPPFENRVPLNVDGFSPGVVVSLGWQINEQFAAQLNKVGTSGMMLQLAYAWR